MAVKFVAVGGSNSNGGTAWDDAYLTVEYAMETGAAAGDTIAVDVGLTDAYAANTVIESVGTEASPQILISSTNGTTGTAIVYNPGAEVNTTGGTYDLNLSGNFISYGIDWLAGDLIQSNVSTSWEIHDATFGLAGTSSFDYIQLYQANSRYAFYNVTFTFGHASQYIQVGGGSSVYLKGCSIDGAGTAVNSFLAGSISGEGVQFVADDCDFSNLASGSDIVGTVPSASSPGANSTFRLSRCLLRETATAGTITNETIVTEQTTIEAFGCGVSSETDGFYFQSSRGTVNDNSSTYLDGTFSLEMDSTAYSVEVYKPLRVMLGEVYADAAAKIGVEIVSTTTLQNDEFWIEVVYPKTGALATSLTATTLLDHDDVGLPVLTGTPANLATSAKGAGDWTGEPGSPVFQKAEIDLDSASGDVTTSSGAGVVQVWVNLAKVTPTTVYVDSKIVVGT